MKIIYLDQFAVSNLADSVSNEWEEIKINLKFLVKERKIICPLSIEHYLESSLRNFEGAKANDLLLNILSKNQCLETEFYITTKLIISLIRDGQTNTDNFIRKATKNYFQDESKITEFKKKHTQFAEAISGKITFGNIINSNTSHSKIKSPENSNLFKVAKRIESNSFCERILEIVKDKGFEIRGDDTPIGKVPNWIDLILEYLFRHYEMTSGELAKLYKELLNNGFENIPTLDIISSLKAFQSVLHKKKTVNDEIDNLRIACSLPISTLLITDKARKHELKQLKLDSKYNCTVLSGSKSDLREIIGFLEKL